MEVRIEVAIRKLCINCRFKMLAGGRPPPRLRMATDGENAAADGIQSTGRLEIATN